MTDADEPDLKTVAGRLQWARMRNRLTSPRQAAARFGWNENTYKAHEQGLRGADGLKTATAEKYARAFGVNAAWLLTGTGGAYATSETQRAWNELTEHQREKALRLVRVAEQGQPLIESVPAEEIPIDPLPAHFNAAKPGRKAPAAPRNAEQKRRR